MDSNNTKWSFIQLEEGREPEAENEIIMDKAALDLLGVAPEIGAEISLTYQITDKNQNGGQKTDTFVLTGWWEYDSVCPVHFINVSRTYVENLEKEMEKKGIVVFHGFQEETRPYYEMADCVVLPSYHEGMSNVLLEASAMGRPVITSDIPGCREAVEDGKSGYLCEVKNADMLFEKMKLMAGKSAEEIEEMGRCARKRMEEMFDKKKVVERTVAIISVK